MDVMLPYCDNIGSKTLASDRMRRKSTLGKRAEKEVDGADEEQLITVGIIVRLTIRGGDQDCHCMRNIINMRITYRDTKQSLVAGQRQMTSYCTSILC